MIISLLFSAFLMPETTVVPNLPLDQANSHYICNRAPLAPTAMIKLPVGSVKAKGWLLEYLKRQKNGLTGHLDEISLWLQKEDSAWFSKDGKGKYGWEEVPYWLKGYADLGYILNDEAIIKESKIWLNGAIDNQRPNGDFGPDHRLANGTRDHWGNMLMLQCLQSYYDYSGDKRVLDLMTKYFRYQNAIPDKEFLTDYWEKTRGGDNLASVYWLYNRTGDPFLLEFAEKNHRLTLNWMNPDKLPDFHNVNVAQSFDEPAIYGQQSHDPQHTQAAYRNFDLIRNQFGQVPGGMFGADENAREGYDDPRQATETCGFVEQMQSDEELLRITGDPKWADHCEEVAFNSYPAAVMPDFSALRYLTAPNMIASDRYNHAPGFQNNGPFTMMNPLSNRCCQHNHSHGWPYFTENLWQATADNGLVAALYSASEVTAKVGEGEVATITEETNYPFEETVRMKIKVDKESSFPIYLRIPAWCEVPLLKVNGRAQLLSRNKGYVKINRTWKSGDNIEWTLPMALSVRTWTRNKNSVSVDYGPLTFSLKIGENVVPFDSASTAVWDARWQENVDLKKWPAFEILPTTPWNYALDIDPSNPDASLEVVKKPWPKSNFPFTLEENPLELKAKGRKVGEWQVDRFGLVAELQDGPVKTSEPAENITLVPMGAARIRISAFPHYSATGNSWKAPVRPLPYAPKSSFAYPGDDVWAVCDQIEPQSSADQTIPRLTFWDHKGTEEWVEYTFAEPKTIKGVEVYWFDDTGKGECRVPASWQVQVKVGDRWISQPGRSSMGVAPDKFNLVNFTPIKATQIRLLVKLQPGFSAGILEWRICE
jgi:hypothetical protein